MSIPPYLQGGDNELKPNTTYSFSSFFLLTPSEQKRLEALVSQHTKFANVQSVVLGETSCEIHSYSETRTGARFLSSDGVIAMEPVLLVEEGFNDLPPK